ncbi:MAG: hypothetical protein HUJ25_04590 [Crocinitomicaceae bacterium]|nr:hypothetical protein [Crocinitomicaceae bacterium]
MGNSKKNKDTSFERDLFMALSEYGYLFPTTEEDVENFESLYGNTQIEAPDFIEFDKGQSDLDISSNSFTMKNAAFNSSQKQKFNFPDPKDLDKTEEE